jgi:hypothetical protein
MQMGHRYRDLNTWSLELSRHGLSALAAAAGTFGNSSELNDLRTPTDLEK